MDYDDNEFYRQNLHLGGEGCSKSKVSPVSHPFALPKFEFDDSLQGHLRFDEVFVGITSQEDNHWIEEYSRVSSGIEFSSSGVESRHNNVWSEATSLESVEILLKSVGQEEKTIIQELDTCNVPGSSLTNIMDPSLNIADGKDNVTSLLNESMDKEQTEDPCASREDHTENLDAPISSAEPSHDNKCAPDTSLISSEVDQDLKHNTHASNAASFEDGKLNVESLSKTSPIETEIGKDVEQIASDTSVVAATCFPDEVLTKQDSDEGVIAGKKASEAQKDDQDGSFNEKEDGSLPMDIEAVQALDNQDSVETSLSMVESKENTVIAPNDVTDVSVPVESDKDSSPSSHLLSAETAVQPNSPIFGVSLLHQDNFKKVQDNSQNEIPQDESVIAFDSKQPSSLVEKEASPGLPEKIVHEIDVHVHPTFKGNNASETEPESSKAKPETTDDVMHDSPMPSKTTDNLEENIQPVSKSKEGKDLTFEVDTSAGKLLPPFQVSTMPKIMEGPSLDATKSHQDSPGPKNSSGRASQTGVKERKPRRKSVKKDNHLKEMETTSVRVEKSNEILGVVSLPKLPDLNNSTSAFQQPFTDYQQVQLRAQILVYGSLISGSAPEEVHMIAAFGQSDSGKSWEGVWHTCLQRVHLQKAHAIAIANANANTNTPSSGLSNKGTITTTTTTPSPSMIPLSSPLWSMATPTPTPTPSGMPRPALYQALGPNPNPNPNPNLSWLSQGPFAAQWIAASPIPAFNTGPRFPALPITDVLKSTPVKESKHIFTTPMVFNPEPFSDSKGRKRKKGSASMVSILSPNQTDSVTAPAVTISPSKSSPVKFLFASPSQHQEKVVISESKVEESKIQAKEAAERADSAVSHCQAVWSQLERQSGSGLTSDDEAKLVSSAVSLAAAASVAKVAAAAAKIASDVAQQARSMVHVLLSNSSQKLDQSSHGENLVKAAEMAAEAVSQAGKIVAMSEPLPLRRLLEAGPEGYWKTPRKQQQPVIAENLNLEAAQVSDKRKESSEDLEESKTMEVDPLTTRGISKRKPRVRKARDLTKTIDTGSTDTLKENDIKEGCLVEVYKDDNKYNGAWFGAHVLSLKDGKAFVCYTEIQSDDGQLKEWVPLVTEGAEVPKTRIAHPMTLMRLEGTKKRSRTAASDYLWSSGDHVDVWMQDRWREGVVMEINKIDPTSLTVKFLGQEETLNVRSWFLRPTLVWKDGKWVECQTLSSQGDTPREKRMKVVVENEEEKAVESKKHEETTTTTTTKLALSSKESVFNVGSSHNNNTMRSGMQKRVVFGVPKPGKKQKFMDVSKHYVGDGSRHHRLNESVKFTKYLIPQAPHETKSRMLKPPRKPPVPSFRTLASSKSSTVTNKTATLDSVSDDENRSSQQNQTDFDPEHKVSTRSDRVNKRKFVPPVGKADSDKDEKSVEPSRRSNRKIQPTSRLLEGLQSSITISKIPAASHFTQRTPHNKGTPKGNISKNV